MVISESEIECILSENYIEEKIKYYIKFCNYDSK